MDLSALMPMLLAQSGGKGDSNNNMMNMLPHLMNMQKGGGDMSEILKMMSGTGAQKKEPEPQPQPQREPENAHMREQAYDTNPQYLTSYYDAGSSHERIKKAENNTYTDPSAEGGGEKKTSRQQLDEMLGDHRSKGGKINDSPKDNMQAKLMAEMMSGGEINPMTLMQLMGNGGKDGFNPMMLMPLMQSMGKKKEGGVNAASAAAANPNALLTKPIEPVAPSQIVLNIRKYFSK